MTRRYDRFPPLADQEPDERPATWREMALAIVAGAIWAGLVGTAVLFTAFIALQILDLTAALIF